MLEETVPTEFIRVKESEDPDSRQAPFASTSEEELLDIIRNLYKIYRKNETHIMALRQIELTTGIGLYPELIKKVDDEFRPAK